MSTQVTLAALKYHAGKLLMLHAGGIARDDGKVAIIIGPSGRGKTTTLRHLGRYLGYVSDETIAMRFDGSVLPYRKPLSIITEGHRDKLHIAPSRLGLKPLPDRQLQIGALAVLERAPANVSHSEVTELGFAAGIIAAVEQSSYLVNLTNPLTLIATLASTVGGFKSLKVGRPDQIHLVADHLFRMDSITSWCRRMPTKLTSSMKSAAAYTAAKVIDAIERQDGTVIFTDPSMTFVKP